MQDMISMVLSAKNDENVREKLIQINRQAILRSASSAAKRYVTESDDEWSVALYAFSRAVDVYTPEKGEFLPFAQMLIHRSLIPLAVTSWTHVSTSPSASLIVGN